MTYCDSATVDYHDGFPFPISSPLTPLQRRQTEAPTSDRPAADAPVAVDARHRHEQRGT